MNRVLAIIIFLFIFQVQAYDGWSTGKISKIRIQSARILIIQENATNPGDCSNTDYIHLSQGDSADLKNMFSSLLTAYAAGKTVSFALSGCSGGYPKISEVWLK